MLRALAALLVLANVAFWAWSQGWLDGIVGVKARGDREPERLSQQLHPELVVVLPAMPAPAASAPTCLESGPYPPTEVSAAESALRVAMPGVAWTNARTEQPGQWVVYLGAFADREAMKKKEDEIAKASVHFEEQPMPGDPFGLVLGRYDERGAADRALAQVQQRGVKTARVVTASAPQVTHVLRVEHAEPAQAAQLMALKSDALARGFAACARSEVAR
jgi:hypothetical protein